MRSRRGLEVRLVRRRSGLHVIGALVGLGRIVEVVRVVAVQRRCARRRDGPLGGATRAPATTATTTTAAATALAALALVACFVSGRRRDRARLGGLRRHLLAGRTRLARRLFAAPLLRAIPAATRTLRPFRTLRALLARGLRLGATAAATATRLARRTRIGRRFLGATPAVACRGRTVPVAITATAAT